MPSIKTFLTPESLNFCSWWTDPVEVMNSNEMQVLKENHLHLHRDVFELHILRSTITVDINAEILTQTTAQRRGLVLNLVSVHFQRNQSFASQTSHEIYSHDFGERFQLWFHNFLLRCWWLIVHSNLNQFEYLTFVLVLI